MWVFDYQKLKILNLGSNNRLILYYDFEKLDFVSNNFLVQDAPILFVL